MDKKLLCLALVTLLFFPSFPAAAQQAKKIPLIGAISQGSPSSSTRTIKAFREGLRDLGYVEGQNITVEYRYADGVDERVADFAHELVINLKAAKQIGLTIPPNVLLRAD